MSTLFGEPKIWHLPSLLLLLVCLSQARLALADPPAYDGKPGTTAGQTCVNPKDNALMVWVPAGDFLMGSAETDARAMPDEVPQHTVKLDGYWIYQKDVTVAQYKAYCAATDEAMPIDAPPWGWKDTHPMVNVNWKQAHAYAKWAGAHLPSEAQWEKAARGTDGRIYPWGNTWDNDKCNNAANGPEKTMPVGSFPEGASPYGCLDMGGNVWQWCEDWYGGDYYNNAPATNPKGPEDGQWRVFRGGGWRNVAASSFRCARRGYFDPGYTTNYLGVRCVVSPPAQ